MSATTPQPLHCPNCGHPVSLPDDVYCRHCGQETRLEAPTVLGFVREFTGQYLSTRGAMARSLKALLVPGRLTEEYLRGRRRHYVLPMRLLLTLALVAVMLNWLLSVLAPLPPDHPKVRQSDPHHARAQALDDRSAPYVIGGLITRFGQVDGQFQCRGLSTQACQRLQSEWQHNPQQLAQVQAEAISRIEGAQHWHTLLLTPWLAFMTRWLYARRRLRFAEHMVLAMHLSAGVALINIPSSLYMAWVHSASPGSAPAHIWFFIATSFVYMAIGWHRILRGRWTWAVLRFLLLFAGWMFGYLVLFEAMKDLFFWAQ